MHKKNNFWVKIRDSLIFILVEPFPRSLFFIYFKSAYSSLLLRFWSAP